MGGDEVEFLEFFVFGDGDDGLYVLVSYVFWFLGLVKIYGI